MSSVMVSSNRIDNVFQGRNMTTINRQQATWGHTDYYQQQLQQQQALRGRNTCGSRSRLLSLPIPSAADSLGLPSSIVPPAGLHEQQHHVFQSQGYETALRRQLMTSSPQSLHSNSSDETSVPSTTIDVIAQTLAQFNFPQQPTAAGESFACPRPKAGLERSISMPAESVLKQQQAQLQQQQQQQAVNTSRYKTEMCRPFEEHGFCKYGDKCQFAHGIRELRTVNRHPKYKTELCRTFHTVGFCAYGSRCHFVHNEDERSAPMPPPSRASPPLSIQSGAAGYPPHHLPLMRCGSLGSAADSPPASPVDVCPPTPTSSTSSFYGTPAVMTSPVSELTLEDISTLIASMRADTAACYNSPPSPPDSLGYGGSEGCYDVMSVSSVESSPSKCPPPSSAFRGVHAPAFSYYNC